MHRMYEGVKAGKTDAQLLEENPNLARNPKAIHFSRFTISRKSSDRRSVGMKVYTLWGPTGTGKTWNAIEQLAGNDMDQIYMVGCPTSSKQSLWFDGYEGQPFLILDDFDSSFCDLRFLLRLLDKYPFQVPIKGSMGWATFTTVIITSNIRPDAWYQQALGSNDLTMLKRRLDHKPDQDNNSLGEIRECAIRDYYQVQTWDGLNVGDVERWAPLPAAAPAPAPAAAPIAQPAAAAAQARTPSPDLYQDAQDYESNLKFVPETPKRTVPATQPWPKASCPFVDDMADEANSENDDTRSDDDIVYSDITDPEDGDADHPINVDDD